MGISIISYNGEVVLGVMVDEGLVQDPEAIMAAFRQEIDDIWRRAERREREQAQDGLKVDLTTGQD